MRILYILIETAKDIMIHIYIYIYIYKEAMTKPIVIRMQHVKVCHMTRGSPPIT